LAGVAGGTFLICSVILIIVIIVRRRNREKHVVYTKIVTEMPIKQIKDVEIVHLIGSGQFGQVYKGLWM
jgi:hypothetical protein